MRYASTIIALLCIANAYGKEEGSIAHVQDGILTVEEPLVDTSDNYYARALALLEAGNLEGFDELASNYSSPDGLQPRSVLSCGWCVAGCQAAWNLKKIKAFCTRGDIIGKNSCRRIVCSGPCGGLAAEEDEVEEV
jgi:hypothetical protein